MDRNIYFSKKLLWKGKFLSKAKRIHIWEDCFCLNSKLIEADIQDIDFGYKDRNQVLLDIARSFVHFEGWERKLFNSYRKKLDRVISFVLGRNPHLHYYQGFHDICSILSLAFPVKIAAAFAERIALFFLQDFMRISMDSVEPYLNFVFFLIKKHDMHLFNTLQREQIPPYICLSWIITWFSHELNDLKVIYYIFDVIVTSHFLTPLYLSAAMIIINRDLIDQHSKSETSDNLYRIISHMPAKTNIFELVKKCEEIFHCSQFLIIAENISLEPSFKSIKYRIQSFQDFIKLRTVPIHESEAKVDKLRSKMNHPSDGLSISATVLVLRQLIFQILLASFFAVSMIFFYIFFLLYNVKCME